ncbi:YMGG-like glycine zipper-containing protein [Hymenobacter weizhouensis]|uniref:YMGG-like glycine zipper-containing protein n=1 Tax=Hymenobacter sp. YIM 151500-1 TaxID=2987689 RepID=UPI002226E2F4|nr:YMGG-like glycine zipper-containing protein [Hymenobacter sp. YIM 151500-1]UYZ61587.1 YMGG-like glycine zipper-containing protein [Hymenobacter sp. YIM 151500-1]
MFKIYAAMLSALFVVESTVLTSEAAAQERPRKPWSRKAKGAAIGGGAGAVTGAVVGGGKGAVIGTVAGAAAGGIIGRKKDKKKDRARYDQYTRKD